METLHPLIVHFPIALLTLYACIELLSLFIKPWKENKNLIFTKTLVLIIGAVGSSLASNSGEAAKHAMEIRTLLVERHEFFAGLSTNLFWGLTIFYLLKWILDPSTKSYRIAQRIPGTIKNIIEHIVHIIEKYYLVYLGALIGLLSLTITGALGGAIVYGTDADIIVQWIVKIVGS